MCNILAKWSINTLKSWFISNCRAIQQNRPFPHRKFCVQKNAVIFLEAYVWSYKNALLIIFIRQHTWDPQRSKGFHFKNFFIKMITYHIQHNEFQAIHKKFWGSFCMLHHLCNHSLWWCLYKWWLKYSVSFFLTKRTFNIIDFDMKQFGISMILVLLTLVTLFVCHQIKMIFKRKFCHYTFDFFDQASFIIEVRISSFN